MPRVRASDVVWIALGVAACPAFAQWTAINLNPAGATQSSLTGVSAGQQVGYAEFAGVTQAALWTGNAASFTSLHPAGASISIVSGVSFGRQVGTAAVGGVVHAVSWNGSAASANYLNPVGATTGNAIAAYGTSQGGLAIFPGGVPLAGFWNGTPASWVNLHPAGLSVTANSRVLAMFGTQQGGFVSSSFGLHGAIWNGTPASWIDLHPTAVPGLTFLSSQVLGMAAGVQVGIAIPTSGGGLASVWRGSPGTWTSIHPPGYESSSANAVWLTQIAGDVRTATAAHAGVWTGLDAASSVDLHAFLPAGYSDSSATSIYSDAEATYVVGEAKIEATQLRHAFLWIGPPPQTRCRPDLTFSAIPGSPGFGAPNGLLSNDDFFYYLAQFAAANLAVADLTATAIPGSPGYGIPNGVLTNDDFFYYLSLFAAGC